MTHPATIKADDAGNRPIYAGMPWSAFGSGVKKQWVAKSECTPISYIVQEIEDGRWTARHGFREAPGRPHVDIGAFASMVIAMTACERHDYRFWASVSERAGLSCIFMGSPDHVSDFISNLAEHDKDDLLDMISGGYELPSGANFMESASFFQAVKTGLKQERNGSFTATIAIDAADLPIWLFQSQPGTKMAIGVADLGNDDADEWAKRASDALKRSFVLPQDNAFHGWIAQRYDRWGIIASAMQQTSEEVEVAVSETLRRLIGCPSRRDFATNRDAILRLERIDREFYLDLSRGFTIGTIA
ncbi:hypothetical protein ACOI1H_21005 [Loktanella sp. DJP18]|uniref:hypothetical protein n=1 Tax=Loktanella sp. DJP18 TaxID=3409788 RepID=UPI003BB7F058